MLLSPVTEWNAKLERLLPESPNAALHKLGDFRDARLCFRMLAQLSVVSLRPCLALDMFSFLRHENTSNLKEDGYLYPS